MSLMLGPFRAQSRGKGRGRVRGGEMRRGAAADMGGFLERTTFLSISQALGGAGEALPAPPGDAAGGHRGWQHPSPRCPLGKSLEVTSELPGPAWTAKSWRYSYSLLLPAGGARIGEREGETSAMSICRKGRREVNGAAVRAAHPSGPDGERQSTQSPQPPAELGSSSSGTRRSDVTSSRGQPPAAL